MQVAFFPNDRRENPYLDLLEAGLRGFGVSIYPTQVYRPYRSWLKQHRGQIDVLHFHWLHGIYQQDGYRVSLTRVLKFWVQLHYAKRLGYRIVWTMHNLFPHERRYPHLDKLMRWLIVCFADAIIVHCTKAKADLEKCFGRQHYVYVAPHGHYIGVYPDTVTRSEARKRLDIHDKGIVYLYLGKIRPYKGVQRLVHSFSSIPNPNLTLVIAGTISHGYSLDDSGIRQILERDPRCILRLGWVPDEDIQLYYRAADVVVYPFENVLTSGSVILALSFGRPVVAPALGCLPELVTPDVGILYDPAAQGSLQDALVQCTMMNLDQMGQNAFQIAKSYSWRNTARVVRAAYSCTGTELRIKQETPRKLKS